MITLHWQTNQNIALQLAKITAGYTFLDLQAQPMVAALPEQMVTRLRYEATLEVNVDDTSYRYRALMQKPQLVLKFSLPEYIDFPVGTWCEFQGAKFTLNSEKNLTKNGKRNIAYDMTMGGDEDSLALYKLRNSVDERLKYSMCAKPHEFIDEIVANLNKREGANVWSTGSCIEATERTVEFNHSYIDAALQAVADAFDTEWEIVNHVISLHKVEYNKDNPLPLSYGKGNGFVPGLGRTTQSEEAPIKRIYTQGGTQNIDRSKYGGAGSEFPEYSTSSAELRLPCSQTLEYEGRTYKTDAQGYYVERSDKVSTAVKEDSLDCSEIYPKRVGTLSSVTVGTETGALEKHFYDVTDTSIPATLDYNNYIIEGETPTMTFQTGMLAGKSFEFKYNHSERKFKLVPQEVDGILMPDPDSGYMPVVGNEYAIFGVMLPKEYICDNANKSGAAWDMFREAAKKLYEREDQKFTFKGDLQGLWAKRNWVNVGGRLLVGGYIHFTDEQFAVNGIDIRISGIKDYINSPYSPTLEISNSVAGSSVRTDILKIETVEVEIEDSKNEVMSFAKRRFRDAQETQDMLSNALLHFSEAVNPVAVQTMSLLVGDESLQFYFVNNALSGHKMPLNAVYDKTTKQLSITHSIDCILEHQTLGFTSISSPHSPAEKKHWLMHNYTSAVLDVPTTKYYLYAKVPRTGDEGEFLLSEVAIDMYSDDNLYYLLVGVLNSEYDNDRSFVELYGFTEILPSRITTDKIVSGDGKSYFDLAGNKFHLGNSTGGYIDWNNETANTLTLNNVTIKEALKVLGEAQIAGFWFSNNIIRSLNEIAEDTSSLEIDGLNGKIILRSNQSGGSHSLETISSVIRIDATGGGGESGGVIETRNDHGVSYMSASGVFSNNPMTQGVSSTTGLRHYGAIVGLGFGRDVNQTWEFEQEGDIVAGVYGRASNTGNAPFFGGFFYNLYAGGMTFKPKYITDSAATTSVTLAQSITQVIGLVNSGKVGTVYLPTAAYEGSVIFCKQMSQGIMRFRPSTGHKIYDDISENDYYDAEEGNELKFTFAKFSIGGVNVQAWLVSRWRF